MKRLFALLLICAGCHHSTTNETLSLIQIHDRNGLTETISNPDRLMSFDETNFLSSQPYKKVFRIIKSEEKNRQIITTYHPNGNINQYLEAEEMRAHGAYREWFPNGQQKIEATIIGGTADLSEGGIDDWLFDNESHVWDEQGNLVAIIPYKKGVLEGKSVYFYPSGVVEREQHFTNNSLNGAVIEYDPQGRIRTKTNYTNGVIDGDRRGYFENGAIAFIEDYSDGRIRSGKYYDLEGNLASEIERGGGFQSHFEGGALTLVEHQMGLPSGDVMHYTSDHEIQKTYQIRNGKKHGAEITYYLSSELSEKPTEPLSKLYLEWKEDMIHGSVKTWYDNGQLQSERQYAQNRRSGPSLAWYRNGDIMLYEEYEEDILHRGQYFKKGKKEPVSSIIKGMGLASLFDENGALLRKINYVSGKPVVPEE